MIKKACEEINVQNHSVERDKHMLLLNKPVDKSLLKQGMSIPAYCQKEILAEMGLTVSRGDKIKIKILLDGKEYDALLTYNLFKEQTYPDHSDILQIRYKTNGTLSQALQKIFHYTVRRIEELQQAGESTRISKLENRQKEYLAIYSTPIRNCLCFECITNDEFLEEVSELQKFDELVTENIFETEDPTASVTISTQLCKVRRMNRAIGMELKKLYGYRCQICGRYIGEKYGSNLIHAHHIEYFTKSLNNDAANILIVCPNHHGIIHDKNPEFDFQSKTYHYPNGYVEGLMLNKHI